MAPMPPAPAATHKSYLACQNIKMTAGCSLQPAPDGPALAVLAARLRALGDGKAGILGALDAVRHDRGDTG